MRAPGSALHLLDRAPLEAPGAHEVLDPWIATWLDAEGIWILDETIPRSEWKPERRQGTSVHWLARLRYPRALDRAVVPLDRLSIPEVRTLHGSGRTRTESEQEAALFKEGVVNLLLTEEHGAPNEFRVSYFANPRPVLNDLSTLDPKTGAFAPRIRTLGEESRRALGAPAPWSTVWDVELPVDARLRFAHGVGRVYVTTTERGLHVNETEEAGCALRVVLRRADGEERILWSIEEQRVELGRYRDVALDLSEHAGERVELRFEFGAPPDPDQPRVPVLLAEPVVEARSEPGTPNIILVLLDTLRADRVGCYGWERAHTPNLDRLAERGARFTNVTSAAPWTLPSLASLLSSMYVSEHGIRLDEALPEEALTLPQALRDASYLTAAFTEGGYVSDSYGLSSGFGLFQTGPRDVERTFERAREWLAGVQSSYFLFIHTYQPHLPYSPPARWKELLVRPYVAPAGPAPMHPDHVWGARGPDEPVDPGHARYMQDLYDAEIAYADETLGQFLRWLEEHDLARDLILVVTSDHGEEFGDHGHFGHGWSLYEEQLRVPLIVHAPGHFTGGEVVEHRVHGVDLAPTLARLAGLAVPAEWSGVPLSLEPVQPGRHVFSTFYTRRDAERATAYLAGDHKYISFPERLRICDPHPSEALFDLRDDPGEQIDRAAGQAGELRRWARAAEHAWRSHPRRFEGQDAPVGTSLTAELEALGYFEGD